MQMTKLFPIATAVTLGIFMLNACSVENADDSIVLPESMTNEMDGKNPEADADTEYTLEQLEFFNNYDYLDFYYINSQTELGDYEEYYQKATGESFADVKYMYSKMSDSYTTYYDPEYFQTLNYWLSYSPSAMGIGAEVVKEDSLLVVSQVYPKAPAEVAGLKAGDIVVSVDSLEISSVELFDRLVTSEVGDIVTLQILRDSVEKEISVTINNYIMPTVFLNIEDSIPMITITEFSDTTVSDSGTYGEFLQALEKTSGAKATIIDLQQNGGGSTEQCLNIASEFLPKNDTILITLSTEVDTTGGPEYYKQLIDTVAWYSATDGVAKDRYIVVLADDRTGSCSEMLMAALSANKKSPVVGTTTYGKGIGQYYLLTYAYGYARITAMKMFDKNFDTYHKVGFLPDYAIADRDSAIAKAVELAKKRKAKRTAGYGTEDLGHFPDKPLLKQGFASNSFPREKGAFKIIKSPKLR